MKVNELKDDLFKAFDESELVTMLEAARLTLGNSGTAYALSQKLDLDGAYLSDLSERLEAFMDSAS